MKKNLMKSIQTFCAAAHPRRVTPTGEGWIGGGVNEIVTEHHNPSEAEVARARQDLAVVNGLQLLTFMLKHGIRV